MNETDEWIRNMVKEELAEEKPLSEHPYRYVWFRFRGRRSHGRSKGSRDRYSREWERGFIFWNQIAIIVPVIEAYDTHKKLYKDSRGCLFSPTKTRKLYIYLKSYRPSVVRDFLRAFCKKMGGSPPTLEWQILRDISELTNRTLASK